ncbi:jg5050 [Pararge aegeria aegeria]|uniref:Jg5050 protein n=1 Tax=Pararge aegeria aegeria TaxID=348720 RepID=A0A8S4SB40_9NEOP|nr:jg5050 [Pararge aegeria aegeria]
MDGYTFGRGPFSNVSNHVVSALRNLAQNLTSPSSKQMSIAAVDAKVCGDNFSALPFICCGSGIKAMAPCPSVGPCYPVGCVVAHRVDAKLLQRMPSVNADTGLTSVLCR